MVIILYDHVRFFSSLVVRQAKPHDAIAELHKQYPSIGAVCLQREVRIHTQIIFCICFAQMQI